MLNCQDIKSGHVNQKYRLGTQEGIALQINIIKNWHVSIGYERSKINTQLNTFDNTQPSIFDNNSYPYNQNYSIHFDSSSVPIFCKYQFDYKHFDFEIGAGFNYRFLKSYKDENIYLISKYPDNFITTLSNDQFYQFRTNSLNNYVNFGVLSEWVYKKNDMALLFSANIYRKIYPNISLGISANSNFGFKDIENKGTIYKQLYPSFGTVPFYALHLFENVTYRGHSINNSANLKRPSTYLFTYQFNIIGKLDL